MVVERHAAYLDAPTLRCIRRCGWIIEGAMKTKSTGRIRSNCVSICTVGASEFAERVPLFDEQYLITGQSRIKVPLMVVRILCKVVLADSIVIVNFENDQILGSYAGGVAERQWIGLHRLPINISPYIDDRETTVG